MKATKVNGYWFAFTSDNKHYGKDKSLSRAIVKALVKRGVK